MPQPRGACVMHAPGLDVVHLKTLPFQIRDRHPDVIEIAAGKDVAPDRLRFLAVVAEELAIGAFGRPGDRVMKVEPTRFEQAVDGRKVALVVRVSDMLEHANGRDLVEAAVQARIILELDRYPVLEPKPGDLVQGVTVLALGER